MNNSIREIQLKDKEQWKELYKGYAIFYKVEMSIQILEKKSLRMKYDTLKDG